MSQNNKSRTPDNAYLLLKSSKSQSVETEIQFVKMQLRSLINLIESKNGIDLEELTQEQYEEVINELGLRDAEQRLIKKLQTLENILELSQLENKTKVEIKNTSRKQPEKQPAQQSILEYTTEVVSGQRDFKVKALSQFSATKEEKINCIVEILNLNTPKRTELLGVFKVLCDYINSDLFNKVYLTDRFNFKDFHQSLTEYGKLDYNHNQLYAKFVTLIDCIRKSPLVKVFAENEQDFINLDNKQVIKELINLLKTVLK